MGTTAKGFTHPDPVSPVGDLPAEFEEFADQVDATVGRHAAGTVTGLALGSAGSTSQAVVFPVGRFTAPPVVVCTLSGGIPSSGSSSPSNNAWAWASNVTASGCNINYRRGAADTGTVDWHAIQVDA